MTGRHLVRTTLALMHGCGAADVSIVIDGHGRPYVVGAPSFSLTHTGHHIVLAIASESQDSSDLAVGVDIEAVRYDIDPLALGRQVLAPPELAALRDAPDRIALFFRLWTLKEAVLKAAGQGLLVDPRTVCIDIRSNPPAILYAPADVAVGGCMVLASPAHHAAALAWCRTAGVKRGR